MLSLQGVSKSFAGAPVLRGIDLTVRNGALIAVLGASGSGKTTLLRLLCGFERLDAGRITLAGRELARTGLHVPAERRRIGYVAQEGALFPHLSVRQNVVFGLGRRERVEARRSEALLELVGLAATYADRLPHQLSGGEQQRVALARALAPRPLLVLLDEPFSALDAGLRTGTRRAVAAALAEAGATAMLVTHDQSEALSMADEVAVLRDGRLVQVASPERLYRRPADLALARFVGEAVVVPGEAADGHVVCALGRLRLADAQPTGVVLVLLRPEQLRLAPDGLPAVVETVTFYGHDASLQLRLDASLTLNARVAGHAAPAPGERVTVRVEGTVTTFRPDEGGCERVATPGKTKV